MQFCKEIIVSKLICICGEGSLWYIISLQHIIVRGMTCDVEEWKYILTSNEVPWEWSLSLQKKNQNVWRE